MKESLKHIDDRIIFRDTFQSEQNTRRLGGVPTDVSYLNGESIFDTSAYINSKTPILSTGTYTIRIKGYIGDLSSIRIVYSMLSTNLDGSGRVRINGGVIDNTYGGTAYVDSVQTTTVSANKYQEIVISGTTLTKGTGNNPFVIGVNRNLNSEFFNGRLDLFEIYEGTLTAEEVKNLYEGKTYHELPDKISDTVYKILDVNALNGVVQNKFDGDLLDNIVVNGDFETGDTTGWGFPSASGSVVSFQGRAKCVKSEVTIAGTSAVIQNLNWGNDTKYKLKFKYYIPSTTSRKKLQIYGIGGTNTQYYVNNSPVLDAWTSVEIEIEANPAHTLFYLYNGGTGLAVIGDIYYFDDIELLPIRELKLTDITTKKIGSNVWSPEFNGSTSKIVYNNIILNADSDDYTILFWAKRDVTNTIQIVLGDYNEQFFNQIAFTSGQIYIESNVNGDAAIATLNVNDEKYHLYSIIVQSGIIKIYQDLVELSMSGTLENPMLINTIGQGGTNGYVFDGKIPRTVIYKGLLSDEQITQFYTNTKRYFK